MNKLNKQKKQLIFASILLLIIGVANYFNYYAPPKAIEKIFSFSNLSPEEQERLIKGATNSNVEKYEIPKSDIQEQEVVEVKPVSNSQIENNYLSYAVDSNGKLVRWNKTKIVVYVSPSEYQDVIYKALSEYNTCFKDYFKFYLTDSREKSDIKIDVVDKFDSNDNPDNIYIAGLTNNNFTGEDKHLNNSIVQLLKQKPNSAKKVTKSEMYKVVLHELGHALGIIGHSPNESDVMFAASKMSTFSPRDIATLKIMYSNNDRLIHRETKNFADIKLKEAEEYAKHTQNKAIPWVNLGRVYYDLNRKEDALNAYKRALSIEPNNPNIYQSMAECYYSSEKYETAIKYYNLAIDYSKSEEQKNPYVNMIGMCYAKMKNFQEAYIYFKKSYDFDNNNKMMFKNYLVSCVELDKKQEAISAIEDYKQKYPSIVEEDFIKDVLKWAK